MIDDDWDATRPRPPLGEHEALVRAAGPARPGAVGPISVALRRLGEQPFIWARVTSFRELAASGEAHCLSPSEAVDLRSVVHNRPLPRFMHRRFGLRTSTPEISYGIFEDAYLLPRFVVLLEDGRLLLDDVVYDAPRRAISGYVNVIHRIDVVDGVEYALLDLRYATGVTQLDCCMVVGGRLHHGHTMFDNFSRFDLLDRVDEIARLKDLSFLRPGSTPWNDHLFDVIAQDPRYRPSAERMLIPGLPHIYRMRCAVVPSIYRRRDLPPRDATRFLRRLVPPPAAGSRGKRWYLSRSMARRRSFTNEEEIMQLAVRHFGAEPLEQGKMSPTEQIAAMRDAELVVGVFGNGFTNMIFSPAGAVLAEVTGKEALCMLNIGIESGHHVISLDRDAVTDRVDPDLMVAAIEDGLRRRAGGGHEA